MADSRLEWHGEAAKASVNRKAVAVLNKCAFTIAGRAKELLSVAGTGIRSRDYERQTNQVLFDKDGNIKTRRSKDGDEAILYKVIRKKKGSRVYGANPSRPGEPPRKQTGTLRRSVQSEVDEASLTARVGTNVEYGKHLELGTKRGIAPRPWLRRAFAESLPKINAWLATLAAKE